MSIESNPEDYYDQQTAADLLLFRNENGVKALRLEAPGIAKEFSDNVYIGKDPPGSLYYNDVADFSRGGNHRYIVSKYTNNRGKVFIIVKFSSDSKSNYALRNALQTSQMDGYSHSGSWGELLNSNTPATLTKSSNSNNLMLTLDRVQRVANWTDSAQNFRGYSINIKGSANFKDIRTLPKGVWARCNHDRAVFYESDYLSKDLIAWFLPLLTEPDIPGPSDRDTVFSGVSWRST
ncbi:hypothetical protein Clacol_001143 [Clathrus columnatus]|uniref:Uncharacterized protein n=1 Tax=Clathrus columnatus TaxID=1419009 RepID=A0AAV4ZXR6_9AGAM|nr:hypothetical protein Clacol_001143 [Clathrus columnatus]